MEKKNYNLGIALGKMLMCFVVILSHFWDRNGPPVLTTISMLQPVAVQYFMVISFFLSEKSFERRDPVRNRRRMRKLIFIQVAWAVLYWLVYVLYLLLVEKNPGAFPGSVKLLLWQIFTGHSPKLNSTMWFQIDLILLTALVILLYRRYSDRVVLGIMAVLAGACLIFQYSGLNEALFRPLRYELCYPIGRFFEVLPLAFAGLLIARSNAVGLMGRAAPLICIAALAVLRALPLPPAPGFDNQGLRVLLTGSVWAMLAISLPLRFLPEKARGVLTVLSRHTMGIYCMHRMMGNLLRMVFPRFGLKTESGGFCLLIYLLSWLACELLSRMPWRWMRELAD